MLKTSNFPFGREWRLLLQPPRSRQDCFLHGLELGRSGSFSWIQLAELNPESMIDLNSVNFSILKEWRRLSWLLVEGWRVIPSTNITFKSITSMATGWILTVKLSREETNICLENFSQSFLFDVEWFWYL